MNLTGIRLRDGRTHEFDGLIEDIRTPDGDLATGTSTDTITIAATGKGKLQNYAGSVTVLGWLIARAVRQALNESLNAE